MSQEKGSAAVELVLVTPVLVVLLLFVVMLGRIASARAGVDAAARDAARAASIARSADQSRADGEAAAVATLRDRGITCRGFQVEVDTTEFRPDASVTATVTCEADLSDLTLLNVPTSATMTGRFSEPIDSFRGVAS